MTASETSSIDLTAVERPTLLHVDSSVRGATSVSRQVGEEFVEMWRAANPDGVVVHRDLGVAPVPHQDEDGWMAGMIPAEAHTPGQAASWEISLPLIGELEAADEYLFSVPMYNLSVPSSFKAWIDRVVVTGRTLMLDGSPAPLRGRKATVISSRGGSYAGERAALDHLEPYLTSLLALLGITDVEFIKPEMTAAGSDPALAGLEPIRDASMEAARGQVQDRAGDARVFAAA